MPRKTRTLFSTKVADMFDKLKGITKSKSTPSSSKLIDEKRVEWSKDQSQSKKPKSDSKLVMLSEKKTSTDFKKPERIYTDAATNLVNISQNLKEARQIFKIYTYSGKPGN
jgi:hypothetical protein